MPTTVGDVIKVIEQIAPSHLALPNDPIGLIIGNKHAIVNKICVCLDASIPAIEFAVSQQCQMIVSHHPVIFRPLSSLMYDDPVGAVIRLCCEHHLSVYSAHTNWDVAEGGVNDALAGLFNLQEVKPLGAEIPLNQYKIVVFVPSSSCDAVISAMSEAGAGVIGAYQRCAFYHQGIGTFIPMENANPTIGAVGKQEQVEEIRVEMIADELQLEAVISSIRQAHPYEEPAYDVIPLKSRLRCGIGRIGNLPRPLPMELFAKDVAEKLNAKAVRFWGKSDSLVKKVACVGGSGGDYVKSAANSGANALLTGEVRHHNIQEALFRNIALIDAGHGPTEMPGAKALSLKLSERYQSSDIEIVYYS